MRATELGRRYLAMRLPGVRGRIMQATHPWQPELFETYHVAAGFRETLRGEITQQELFDEYEQTCLEIERDVERAMNDDGQILTARVPRPDSER